ncbi:MAG: choice-of-anchor K domain-containing protein [Phormidesmis sp.]
MFDSALLTSAALAAAASLTVLLPAPQAHAATLFIGGSNGTFGTPTVDPSVDPDAMFSVQKPNPQSETFVMGEPGPGSMPNQLTFSGVPFATLADQPFAVGNLSYLNGQTYTGTHVSSVPFGASLYLTQPVQTRRRFDYLFSFDLTLNANAPDADAQTSADSLTISENPAAQAFNIGQESYSVEVLGFSQDGGTTFTRRFQVFEDETVSGALFAQIKLASISRKIIEREVAQPTTEVPEPASIAGLLMLGSAALLRKPTVKS